MSSIPFYAKRFISGSNSQEAFEVVRKLNKKNICVTLDVLGENIAQKQQATEFTEEYLQLINDIFVNKLNCYVSVKLTMLGLDIEENFCYENLTKILKKSDELKIRVAFDMEGSSYTERTLSMYEKASKEFESAEIVLQAYLIRTELDIDRVLAANGKLRLCKGAYKESKENAYLKMNNIVDNYIKLVGKLLLSGKRVCIATHDDKIINYCMNFIEEHKIPKDRYEFQMLYGMRQKTWEEISAKGHNITVYVPFGKSWKAYYLRRLAERKENVFFVVRNLFRR